MFCGEVFLLQSLRHGKPCHLPLHKGGFLRFGTSRRRPLPVKSRRQPCIFAIRRLDTTNDARYRKGYASTQSVVYLPVCAVVSALSGYITDCPGGRSLLIIQSLRHGKPCHLPLHKGGFFVLHLRDIRPPPPTKRIYTTFAMSRGTEKKRYIAFGQQIHSTTRKEDASANDRFILFFRYSCITLQHTNRWIIAVNVNYTSKITY